MSERERMRERERERRVRKRFPEPLMRKQIIINEIIFIVHFKSQI